MDGPPRLDEAPADHLATGRVDAVPIGAPGHNGAMIWLCSTCAEPMLSRDEGVVLDGPWRTTRTWVMCATGHRDRALRHPDDLAAPPMPLFDLRWRPRWRN